MPPCQLSMSSSKPSVLSSMTELDDECSSGSSSAAPSHIKQPEHRLTPTYDSPATIQSFRPLRSSS